MGRWRWRAFGLGLLLAAALGVLAGALEAFGSHPMDIGRPDLGDLAYAVDLHLLAGLAIALALRLLFWRTTERTFPTIVLGGMLMLELGVVGAHWVTKAPFLPPFYTTAGKAVGALAAVIGLALGAWIARSLSRAVRGEAWMRWVRGLAGALGIILAVGIGVANLIQVYNPEVLIVGGGIAQAGRLLFEPMLRTVRARAHMVPASTARIVPAQLGDDAGVIGGAVLAASELAKLGAQRA